MRTVAVLVLHKERYGCAATLFWFGNELNAASISVFKDVYYRMRISWGGNVLCIKRAAKKFVIKKDKLFFAKNTCIASAFGYVKEYGGNSKQHRGEACYC